MSENAEAKIPSRTERYAAVMKNAAEHAMFRAKKVGCEPLITLSDVFEAVCLVHPEAFGHLLGRNVSLPTVRPLGGVEPLPSITHSSDVDRYLSPYGGIIEKMCEPFATDEMEVDSLHIAAALLWEPIPETLNMLSVCGIPTEMARSSVAARLRQKVEQGEAERRRNSLGYTFENLARIREFLLARCFGQDDAVKAIVTQLSIAWGMPPAERGSKPLSFFFVGAPGTGKNHLTSLLQDAFEAILGIPKLPIVDFARFATEQLPIELIGRDPVWKDGGHEGVLTGMAAGNPRGIIVIENYDRGHDCAISYLDSILETGFTVDEYTKNNVCFSGNVFVVITHKKEFAESDEFLALVSKDGETPPRDKIIEGLVKFEPRFHSTLRLVDMPILFKKHDFQSFFSILRNKLKALEERFSTAYDAVCEFESEEVYRLLVEMHPNMTSAHPIVAALESSILMPLQEWLLCHFSDFSSRRKIRIACDSFPDFEGAPQRGEFPTFCAWLRALHKRHDGRGEACHGTTVKIFHIARKPYPVLQSWTRPKS